MPLAPVEFAEVKQSTTKTSYRVRWNEYNRTHSTVTGWKLEERAPGADTWTHQMLDAAEFEALFEKDAGGEDGGKTYDLRLTAIAGTKTAAHSIQVTLRKYRYFHTKAFLCSFGCVDQEECRKVKVC